MITINIGFFLLGTFIASFLNATLYRIDNKYKYPDIIKLRSHCEKCKKLLKWWELIPILGYILIGGRCSKCNTAVNIYYPLSEFFLGTTFLLFHLHFTPWYLWIVVLFLFILSYFDIQYNAIYKKLVHIFLLFCFVIFLLYAFNPSNTILPLLFTLLLLVLNIFKKSFGLGDILILLGAGTLLNWQQYLVMFWMGILVALLYSVIIIIKDKVKIKGAKIPMIPFFTISFILTTLYGEEIYIHLLKLMGIW